MQARSLRAGILQSTAFAALALAAAGAGLGAITIESPTNGAAIVGGAALLTAGLLRPKAVLYLALLAMVWTPNNRYPLSIASHFGSYAEVQKSLIWLSALFLAQQRGFDRRLLAPLLAYPLVAVISALGGTPAPGLHLTQILSTLASLTAAWALLTVRWDLKRDADVLVLIALIPVITVLAGIVLDLAGVRSAFDLEATPHRLQGAGIPSSLGNGAIVAFSAAIVLHRERLWRFAGAIAVIDAGLLFGSLSRAAMIALFIAAVPMLWRVVRDGLGSGQVTAALRTIILIGGIAATAAVVVPAVQQRNSQSVYVPGVGVEQDATSGRSEAWSRAYHAAQENIVFGRGIGAGPQIGATQEFFLAQHNEYLRMLLEGGYVGGIMVLASLVLTLAAFITRAGNRLRPELAALCVASAVLAATDNPLTSPSYAARLALLVGIAIGASRWARLPSRHAVIPALDRHAPRRTRPLPAPPWRAPVLAASAVPAPAHTADTVTAALRPTSPSALRRRLVRLLAGVLVLLAAAAALMVAVSGNRESSSRPAAPAPPVARSVATPSGVVASAASRVERRRAESYRSGAERAQRATLAHDREAVASARAKRGHAVPAPTAAVVERATTVPESTPVARPAPVATAAPVRTPAPEKAAPPAATPEVTQPDPVP